MENSQEEHLGQDGNNSLGNISQRKVEEDGRSKLRRRRRGALRRQRQMVGLSCKITL